MFEKRRKHDHAQTNLLRAQGVAALGTLAYDGKETNPVATLNIDREKYRLLWSDYDMRQCTSRYVWENLPDNIQGYDIERMLYFRTSLTGFKYGGHIYILPYVIQGTLNPYGYPTKGYPLTYNGKPVADNEADKFGTTDGKQVELTFDASGVQDGTYNAVLLYDAVPRFVGSNVGMSRYKLNQIIIADMAEVLARVNINLTIANKKLFMIIKDANQRAIIQRELNTAFGSDTPIVLVSSPLDIQTVQDTSDYQADDLFNTLKNYDAIRCFMSGIASQNFGTEKKERLVTGELAGNAEQVELVADMGLELRNKFANNMNKLFGLNIKVHKRADEYKDEAEQSSKDTYQLAGGNEY